MHRTVRIEVPPVNGRILQAVDEPGDDMGTPWGVSVDAVGSVLWTSGGGGTPRRRDQR